MEIRLFATFRENRGKTLYIDCYEGIDGYAVLETLQIAPEDVAIFLIDGHHSKLDTKLKNDNVIALFPPVGGG